MRISVIGAGYVGLVSAAGFSEFGNDVICCDNDANRIANIGIGVLPFFEPGLDDLVRSNMTADRLTFTTSFKEAILRSDVIFVAVGTPQSDDGSADMRYLDAVIEEIALLNDTADKILVLKSTVPVGTADKIRARLGAIVASVASNPEFLREGTAVQDFLRPDRVVIGVNSALAGKTISSIYEPVSNVGQILIMDSRSAELTKYASNAMLATRISFMNEMANIAEGVGADIDAVRKAVGADSRIGPKYLYPGPGFGGSCFTKDLNALRFTARNHDKHCAIIEATLDVNDRQKNMLFNKIVDFFGEEKLEGLKVGIWGLAFKAQTDDIRDTPAIPLINRLLEHKCEVLVHDPAAMENIRKIYGDSLTYCESMYGAVMGVDALCLVTEWRQYRGTDFSKIRTHFKKKALLVDGRNIWHEKEALQAGLAYCRIGKKAVNPYV